VTVLPLLALGPLQSMVDVVHGVDVVDSVEYLKREFPGAQQKGKSFTSHAPLHMQAPVLSEHNNVQDTANRHSSIPSLILLPSLVYRSLNSSAWL
jgi:hypothetical protein